MKIIVCIKYVPPNEGAITLNRESDWIHEGDTSFEVGEADACALEEALLIRDTLGGEVVVLSLGAASVVKCLKDALAKGADSAIHVLHENAYRLSPRQLAKSIASVLIDEAPTLVVTGTQSNDRGNGQLAPNLAQALGFAHATMIVGINTSDTGFEVTRELEGGRAQKLSIPMPCVLALQSGINKPRYASMKGIMAAKKKQIRTLELPRVDLDVEPRVAPARLHAPKASTTTQILDGDAITVATALSQLLVRRKRVG